MDEILIDEKKYVSSKRAAKMTGYAKDYIGQLCREGRVPARLVGRSWYVLETAIQDHRFGTADIQSEETILSPAWESPRYEASSEELLPSINRLLHPSGRNDAVEDTKEDNVAVETVEQTEVPINAPESLQDSWKEWFNHVSDDDTTEAAPVFEQKAKTEEKEPDEEPVNIPIRTVYEYELPPEDLLPRRLTVQLPSDYQESKQSVARQYKPAGNRGRVRAVQFGGILFSVIAVTLAVIGSGYLDEYIISHSQVRIMAGVGVYNK